MRRAKMYRVGYPGRPAPGAEGGDTKQCSPGRPPSSGSLPGGVGDPGWGPNGRGAGVAGGRFFAVFAAV